MIDLLIIFVLLFLPFVSGLIIGVKAGNKYGVRKTEKRLYLANLEPISQCSKCRTRKNILDAEYIQ